MMMTAGFFRLLPDLPKPFWRYPISFLSYGSWSLQVLYDRNSCAVIFNKDNINEQVRNKNHQERKRTSFA